MEKYYIPFQYHRLHVKLMHQIQKSSASFATGAENNENVLLSLFFNMFYYFDLVDNSHLTFSVSHSNE